MEDLQGKSRNISDSHGINAHQSPNGNLSLDQLVAPHDSAAVDTGVRGGHEPRPFYGRDRVYVGRSCSAAELLRRESVAWLKKGSNFSPPGSAGFVLGMSCL